MDTQAHLCSVPKPVLRICTTLKEAGFRSWIVGGSVRDALLKKEVSDWDIATSAKPKQVIKLFSKVIPTGIQHGTVTVRMHEESFEVTTLRGETTYSDGRRPDQVYFVDDINDDLARRDFTINAIAYDPLEQILIDTFDGLKDLKQKTIRAVGNPLERFNEDGLRILRAARFSATLQFRLEERTLKAIPNALETFKKVSPERVREEWIKTMKAETPSVAFELMRETGVLACIFPEMVHMHGCDQNQWHAFDVWTHTMKCLDACEGGTIEKMAALLHDVGKPVTREKSEKTNDWTFYNHEKVGAKMANKWLRAYRFSNEERQQIVHLIRHHLVCYKSDWTDAAIRRFIRRVEKKNFEPLMQLCRADVLAKGRPVDEELALFEELENRVAKMLEEGAALSTKELVVSGSDIIEHLGIVPGPKIGIAMRALLEKVTEDPSLNNREQLFSLLDEMKLD